MGNLVCKHPLVEEPLHSLSETVARMVENALSPKVQPACAKYKRRSSRMSAFDNFLSFPTKRI